MKNHRNKSVMKHTFSQVPKAEIPRSTFDRSHGHKTAFDAGYLVPIFVDEALPGDTYKVNMTAFARLATPIFPVMDNMFMETQFFAVPVRLVWDNWQKFNGEQIDPGDSTSYTIPTVTSPVGGYPVGSVFDYMGLPTVGQVDAGSTITHSALHLRAYSLIWNAWYRDQNLQDSLFVPTDDGPDNQSTYGLLRRGKRHDYFTSSLPWPQKGDAVNIPLGTSAPVFGTGIALSLTNGAAPAFGLYENAAGGLDAASGALGLANGAAVTPGTQFPTGKAAGVATSGASGLYADLSSATAATINALRQAWQIQRIYERDARGGTRYTEIIKAHFGVTSPDARLQRPEYLGGGSSPINVSPIPQTSSTDGTSPQGNLAAMGTALLNGHGFTMSFTEHCLIIGIVSVRADLTYQQGLERMWSRSTRFDFYWPALSHIGEQAVLNKEIYATGTSTDADVFGYQERYGEYRYKPSRVSGLFRSTSAGTLDAWHLSQKFTALPTLSSDFIVENPPIDRVIAVPSEPHFIFDSYFQMHCARPMPVYGVPGLVDHF